MFGERRPCNIGITTWQSASACLTSPRIYRKTAHAVPGFLTVPKRLATIGRTRRRLLYRSAGLSAHRSGAALDLTPRALGWRSIHFGVRQLAPGATWQDRADREERCLVLLRGAFDISWNGRSNRIGPRADVFAGYPHAVYVPAGVAFRVAAVEACEIADCRAAVSAAGSRATAEPRVIRPMDCGYEIRGGGNATRQIVDII